MYFNFQSAADDSSENLLYENTNVNNPDKSPQGGIENVINVKTTEIMQNEVSLSKGPKRKVFASPKKLFKKKKSSSDDHKLDTAWNTLHYFPKNK